MTRKLSPISYVNQKSVSIFLRCHMMSSRGAVSTLPSWVNYILWRREIADHLITLVIFHRWGYGRRLPSGRGERAWNKISQVARKISFYTFPLSEPNNFLHVNYPWVGDKKYIMHMGLRGPWACGQHTPNPRFWAILRVAPGGSLMGLLDFFWASGTKNNW